MSENKKYTIVVKSNRVEVSESVYHAYHKLNGKANAMMKSCMKFGE